MDKIKKIKKILKMPKGYVPKAINDMIYFYDNSAMSMSENEVELICRELRILTHTIEKGMSLPKVKKGFGKSKIIEIQRLLDRYISIDRFDYDYEAFTNAIGILKEYLDKAKDYGCDESIIDFSKYEKYFNKESVKLGTQSIEKVDASKLDFASFAQSRHSSRNYVNEHISDEMIEKIIRLAQTAPSACNRQSSKVMHISDREKTKKILNLQGGAKGHSNSDLLLVISDLSLYRYTSEISTPFLDGGIFLMNLLYSIHYYNYQSCPLIWDDYSDKGVKLREIVDIPKQYMVVAVVQLGNAPSDAQYAVSKRRENGVII